MRGPKASTIHWLIELRCNSPHPPFGHLLPREKVRASFTRKSQKISQRNGFGTHSEQQWNGNRMGKWYNKPEDMRYTRMLAAYLIHLNP
jgi:hypothetical protein